MLKNSGVLLLAAAMAAATPAAAMQPVVTQVDKNADGTMTYYFTVKVDQGETMTSGGAAANDDFVTVYNFYGLVEGSVKSPDGWKFSSEQFGRTPALNGYPMVLPLDVPNTPTLTWTVTKPVAAGAQVAGFTATTRVVATVQGAYSAQVTRQTPAIPGMAAGESKQAVIGALPTPSFLADVK